MATIADLEVQVQDRLDETRDGVGEFWSIQDEIRPFLVEAMNEAALLTGEPQIRSSVAYALTQNSNVQAMPAGALAILRIEGLNALSVNKYFACDLDRQYPAWENDTATSVQAWFPIGLTQFGVYPKLTAPQSVIISYVGIPVTAARPYTGAETLPFQVEFHEGFTDYAAHVARLKESSVEFQTSMSEYDRWLSKLQDMTTFAARKDKLRFFRPGSVSTFTNLAGV